MSNAHRLARPGPRPPPPLSPPAGPPPRAPAPPRLVRHPLVYTLSLGVYASAWAFYGTVGLAYQY
ncbi:hypothetical protein RWG53_23670, partial [Pseudomonas aeruginosa]|uniref:hypothetical protein n=1 Tax=Pseudomonas aeruginosa TaxID=287 RepID=UPI0028FD627B